MRHLTASIRLLLQQQNWYSALAVALMIPDVCSGLELDRKRYASDYMAWCDRYVLPLYQRPLHNITIPGREIYVLRCAYLHSGSDDVSTQDKKDVLERYRFVEPLRGLTVPPRQVAGTRTLQLPVDTFCNIICEAADEWAARVLDQRDDVKRRAEGLLKVYDTRTDGVSLGVVVPAPPSETPKQNVGEPAPVARPPRKVSLDKH